MDSRGNRTAVPAGGDASDGEGEYVPQLGNRSVAAASSRVTAAATKKTAATASTTEIMDLTGDDIHPPTKAPTARGGRGGARGRGSRGGGRGNKAVTPTKTPLNISVI